MWEPRLQCPTGSFACNWEAVAETGAAITPTMSNSLTDCLFKPLGAKVLWGFYVVFGYPTSTTFGEQWPKQ